MNIQVQLKDIIQSNQAIEYFGLNPYCINEGGNGDAWYEIDAQLAFDFGLFCDIKK